MLTARTIIDEGLQLKPEERYIVIEALTESLDTSNPEIEKAWTDEAVKRLEAYKKGELRTISLEEMFS